MAVVALKAAPRSLPRERQRQLVARLHALQERFAERLARRLRQFFREQARRAARRYLDMAKGPSEADLLPPEEDGLLLRAIIADVLELVVEVGALAGALVGAPPFGEADPRLMAILGEAGERIRRISEETREAVREMLREAVSRGYNLYQTAYGVPRDGFRGIVGVVEEVYRGRAETIARTEMAWAMQRAAHDRYGAAGVTEVDVWDGPDCGLRYHDDPEKVNGRRYPVGVIEEYPIAHPNCRRVSLPVLPR